MRTGARLIPTERLKPAMRRNWNRDELVVALNLYCRIPFGKIHYRNPEIIALAKAMDRTPSALSWKLANFASLDQSLKARNISGAQHGGKLEKEIWTEFNEDWERLSYESEVIRARMSGQAANDHLVELPEGKTKDQVIRARINQGFFRAAILAAYDARCCITGLSSPELLCASHIVPWSVDIKNRTNPRNGLCLNALHDRAFDRGLITVGEDLRIKVSPKVKQLSDAGVRPLILDYENVQIHMPGRFSPLPSFLEFHRREVFQGTEM